MENNNDYRIGQIDEIVKELDSLPKGTLVYKNINGKKQPYLQQTINGKSQSTYIKLDGRAEFFKLLERREQLIHNLKTLRKTLYNNVCSKQQFIINENPFSMRVLTDYSLREFIKDASDLKERECISELNNYLYDEKIKSKVFILYGLRRTGKTTLIKQIIRKMSPSDFSKTAYIICNDTFHLGFLSNDLKILMENGYKYVFIDEITKLPNFINSSSFIPDTFVGCGMKIVFSGTDSLGFWLAKSDELYDRTILCHTTFISYKEFERILEIKGIDKYIEYGGTLNMESKLYNKDFCNNKITQEYVDSAIAKNIQHSLCFYDHERHFRSLEELYQKDELTSAINRVVENINHSCTIKVLTSDFISHDLGLSMQNISLEDDSLQLLKSLNVEKINQEVKDALEILNKNEQTVIITDYQKNEIEYYLKSLDILKSYKVEFIPRDKKFSENNIITQPGLRYSQAKILVDKVLKDSYVSTLNLSEKNYITNKILNEIKGRMMEEIVILETTLKYEQDPNMYVCKVQFIDGEIDMLVYNGYHNQVSLYEIKHSDKVVEKQYLHLIDKNKISLIETYYGPVKDKNIIYRGESVLQNNGINYINVEEYLKSL